MRKFLIFSLSAIFLFFIALAVWMYQVFHTAPVSSTKTSLTFMVPKGATATEVATLLQQQGISQKTYYFILLAKTFGKLKQIKAGEYQIAPNTTAEQLLLKLEKGQVVLHKITFPEGWTFAQILAALAAAPQLSHTLGNQTPENIMATIGHAGEHSEGMFYPDTYLFTLGTKDTQILRLAYNLMQKKLTQAWLARALDLPYKAPYEALIVASLIEREARLTAERPKVAGVILHRLKIGMRLQIDAAVLYGVSDKTRPLTRAHLAMDTPYNTYTRAGLPPTPIAMPGSSAIEAALHPIASNALYYVAKGDGSHIFSDNLEQHQVAVQAYRQQVRLTQDQPANYLQPYSELSGERILLQCFSGQLLLHYFTMG